MPGAEDHRPPAVPIGERQLIFVTGKGGVGKTTVAAAWARACRDAGRRTLVAEVTSDIAEPSQLLGLFGVRKARGEEPMALGPNLDGVRICPATGHRLFLRATLRVGMLADAAMRSAALNRFLMAAPAFPEIGILYQLVWLLRRGGYASMVVDLPATGHAIGLAKLPRTVSRVVPTGHIRDAIVEGLAAMTDPARTAAVVVALPETLPVTESFELVRGLRELQIPVGALLLNRMPADPFTAEERQALDEHVRARQGGLLLGTREFRRLERALEAREIFRNDAPGDLLRLELAAGNGSGNQIVDQVAGDLKAEGVVYGWGQSA